jgi:hypothetical protein
VRLLAGLVGVIAIVVIGMAAVGVFDPPAPSSTATGTPRSAPPTTASPTSTQALTLTFTEDELTKAAQGYMPLTVGGITVSDPHVKLDTGKLTLTATGRAFILSGPVIIVASPVVANGTARATIESATFAGFAVPDSTKSEIGDTFTRVLAANIPAGVRVTSVTVTTGALRVEAVPG